MMNEVVRIVAPMEILKASRRFDLVFKVALAKVWDGGSPSEIREAEEAYLEMVRSRNGFYEDEPLRNTPREFIESFRKTAASIRQNGYDLTKQPIPVDSSNELLNGTHRLAACVAYGCKCPVVVSDMYPAGGSVYKTFVKGHIHEAVRNWGVRKYFELVPDGCLCEFFGAKEAYPLLHFPDWAQRNRSAWLWKIRPAVSWAWNKFVSLFRSGARLEKTQRRLIRESKKITGFAALADYWKEHGE